MPISLKKRNQWPKMWAKLHLRTNNNNQQNYYYNSSSNDSGFSRIVEAIRLYATLENRSAVERIVRKFPQEVNNRKAIAALIENKFYVQARKICLQNWGTPDVIIYGEKEHGRFTKKLRGKFA